jgi:hypothetical protein
MCSKSHGFRQAIWNAWSHSGLRDQQTSSPTWNDIMQIAHSQPSFLESSYVICESLFGRLLSGEIFRFLSNRLEGWCGLDSCCWLTVSRGSFWFVCFASPSCAFDSVVFFVVLSVFLLLLSSTTRFTMRDLLIKFLLFTTFSTWFLWSIMIVAKTAMLIVQIETGLCQ